MEIAEPSNPGVRLYPNLEEAKAKEKSVLRSLKGRGTVRILQTETGEYWVYFAI